MSDIKRKFEDELQLMSETAGRGRGPQVGVGVRDMFKDAWKTVNYDYLNRSTHHVFKEEKYDFNNYYSLDIRINTDKLLKYWAAGETKYTTIFNKLWDDNYSEALRKKILKEYEFFYNDKMSKAQINNKTVNLTDPSVYVTESLETLKNPDQLGYLYNEIPVVSVYTDDNGREFLTIKRDEFISLIMNGMSSAIRGHVPQGVTIEEILQGKFSRKAIAPEQGTFINRVKDPTSDKDFDFRSWDAKTLEGLHDLIMNTFKRDALLKLNDNSDTASQTDNNSEPSPYNRESLFLYITQDNFHALEKGGKGFSKLANNILGQVTDVANRPDV